ncbi:arsenate reductase ArsC [Thermodesulfobacteriota bacterium]
MESTDKKKRVLFICTHNSARSQIAEGLMNSLYNEEYEAFSAGTEPSEVNSCAIEAMAEIGIDISNHYSKNLEEFIMQEFDYVITVCDHANETCPFFPGGKERIHKGFKDPAAYTGTEQEIFAAFRGIRDEIKDWIDKRFSV